MLFSWVELIMTMMLLYLRNRMGLGYIVRRKLISFYFRFKRKTLIILNEKAERLFSLNKKTFSYIHTINFILSACFFVNLIDFITRKKNKFIPLF